MTELRAMRAGSFTIQAAETPVGVLTDLLDRIRGGARRSTAHCGDLRRFLSRFSVDPFTLPATDRP